MPNEPVVYYQPSPAYYGASPPGVAYYGGVTPLTVTVVPLPATVTATASGAQVVRTMSVGQANASATAASPVVSVTVVPALATAAATGKGPQAIPVITAVPGLASATASAAAPTVSPIVVPGRATTATSAGAPAVIAGQIIIPAPATATATAFAPTVHLTSYLVVTPQPAVAIATAANVLAYPLIVIAPWRATVWATASTPQIPQVYWTFCPPVIPEIPTYGTPQEDPIAARIRSFYKPLMSGVAVFKMDDGSYWVSRFVPGLQGPGIHFAEPSQPVPRKDQVNGVISTSWLNSQPIQFPQIPDVLTVYYGGRCYYISDDEAADLLAAGWGLPYLSGEVLSEPPPAETVMYPPVPDLVP